MSAAGAAAAGEVEALLQFVYQFPVAVLRMDAAGAIDLMNPRAAALLASLELRCGPDDGWTLLEALGTDLAARTRTMLQTPGLVAEQLAIERRGGQGALHHLAVTVVVVDPGVAMLALEDVTRRVEQERQLAQQRQNLALLLEMIRGYCIATLDLALCVSGSNRSIERTLGFGDGIVGRPWSALMLDAAAGQAELERHAAAARSNGWAGFEAAYRSADGSAMWCETMLGTVVDERGQPSGYVVVARDVTERHQRETALVRQAASDPLTGLLNRRGLAERMAQLQAQGRALAAVALDVDHFKEINDRHGHDGGDEVLRHLARLLEAAVRKGDAVARLGGEEFLLLLPDADESAAAALAERVRARVQAAAVPWGEGTIACTVSLGAAAQPAGPADAADLLQRADRRLYRAKREGRNRVVASD